MVANATDIITAQLPSAAAVQSHPLPVNHSVRGQHAPIAPAPRHAQALAKGANPPEDSWAQRQLAMDGSWTGSASKLALGLGLSLVFGLALGMRAGGSQLWMQPLGVALAPVLIVAFGLPSLFIVLALFDVPIEPLSLARCGARSVVAMGICFAGIAPAAALFVVSSESGLGVVAVGTAGLLSAGLLGLGHFANALRGALRLHTARQRLIVSGSLGGFMLFATTAAVRIWFPLLKAGAAL